VFLMVVNVTGLYALDRFQGFPVVGADWNPSLGHRFGSAVLLPVHLPIAWLQCLVLSLLGMAIAARRLSAPQVARLATWLLVASGAPVTTNDPMAMDVPITRRGSNAAAADC